MKNQLNFVHDLIEEALALLNSKCDVGPHRYKKSLSSKAKMLCGSRAQAFNTIFNNLCKNSTIYIKSSIVFTWHIGVEDFSRLRLSGDRIVEPACLSSDQFGTHALCEVFCNGEITTVDPTLSVYYSEPISRLRSLEGNYRLVKILNKDGWPPIIANILYQNTYQLFYATSLFFNLITSQIYLETLERDVHKDFSSVGVRKAR
jgi:hypothetical protein